jgi:hypothetical protein
LVILPRVLARRFRAVLRRCAPPRTPPPPVLLRAGVEGLSLESILPEVAVRLDHTGRHPQAVLAFPATVLSLVEGRRDDPVTLELKEPGQGIATWSEAGAPCTKAFATLATDGLPPFPEPPVKFRPMSAGFLVALTDASETAAREPSRFAVARVLLRGAAGQLVATDGHQLLIQSGFPFPWPGDVLVPRLAVWNIPELTREGPAAISRTDNHVFVRAGPWTLALAIDTTGRFPPFEQAIPKERGKAGTLQFDREGVTQLLKELPRLAGDKQGLVTLELNEHVAVRAQARGQEPAAELDLAGSRWSGSPTRVGTDRRHLLWALHLGFTEVAVVRPSVPLVCRDVTRTYVWMPLGPDTSPPPAHNGPPSAASVPAAAPPGDNPKENVPMPNPNTSDRRADNGDGPTTPSDPQAEAEAIRTLLAEAQSRLGRLIASLRFHRKQARAVRAAVASLRQLPPLTP